MPVVPPRPKGPPLNALRAFEAAARLGGFAAAADALGLAVRSLRDISKDRTVTIPALPSVAHLWLAPKTAHASLSILWLLTRPRRASAF
ncbi:DNA-binding transcriptional activator GcvA [Octadecabacter ascidiaceicola]|uniref:DNA-binding transcriptional activator GcvA n=1 Tax=Octadecabacter ascidiaceicola TaxID=1655543 RepID=A0A238KBS8_9RHOB|nr:DNA-binding transcriptional activator GcvA [Octadecabacter ascidiaceicola]